MCFTVFANLSYARNIVPLPLVGRGRGGGMRRRTRPPIKVRARALRNHATTCEVGLWWRLRELNAHGFHFRRQSPFRSYILDFVEHKARLVIELDGHQHSEDRHKARDARRDQLLNDEGYRVLRFWNQDVLKNIDGVLDVIVSALPSRPAPHPAARRANARRFVRPPHQGEVESPI